MLEYFYLCPIFQILFCSKFFILIILNKNFINYFDKATGKLLWETLLPSEYPFESNVDPAVPHPRWSQATERLIDTGDRVRTQPYNGYASVVAKLYPKRGA